MQFVSQPQQKLHGRANGRNVFMAHRAAGVNRETVRLALVEADIEARPLWKPMHLQPVFKDCRIRGGGVSELLFENVICLPSGSALTEEDLARICTVVRQHTSDSRS